jgi:cellulose synthase operon protein YhjQ
VNVLAIVSAKGGVGKTTLTANLAFALNINRRVVCLDLDPQNALRLHLGVAVNEIDGVARCSLEGRRWDTAIFQSQGNPEVLPFAMLNESDYEAFTTQLAEQPNWLMHGIQSLNLKDNDYLVIDTPPGRSLYLQQALRAANLALIVIQPDAATYATIPAMESLLLHYAKSNEYSTESAYLLNNVDSSKALTRDIVDLLRSNFDDRLVPTIVHQDETVRESLASDQLLVDYDPHCEAALDIANCAQWVSDKINSKRKALNRKQEFQS